MACLVISINGSLFSNCRETCHLRHASLHSTHDSFCLEPEDSHTMCFLHLAFRGMMSSAATSAITSISHYAVPQKEAQYTSPLRIFSINAKRHSLFFSFTHAMHADRLYCTVGVHPTRCKEIEDSCQGPEAYWDALRVLLKAHAADGKIVAVGECGLDYDRYSFPRLLLTSDYRCHTHKYAQNIQRHLSCCFLEVYLTHVGLGLENPIACAAS